LRAIPPGAFRNGDFYQHPQALGDQGRDFLRSQFLGQYLHRVKARVGA
jgi:hypothetical protein